MSTYGRYFILVLVLCSFFGTAKAFGGLVDSAEQHNDGWLYLDWFGWFYEADGGYLNHTEHGLLYERPGEGKAIFYYELATASWYFTTKTIYPYVYKYGANEGWYFYYVGGIKGERWYYRLSDGRNLMETKINLNETIEEGFSLIRSATFLMGSPEDELGHSADETQTSVTIPHNFIVSQTEITYDEWYLVGIDAYADGYTDLPEGRNGVEGDDSGLHPVTEVSWYDVIKWLNALSEQEGADPCYRVNGEVYRTGISEPDFDIQANGYRLLTEAEWELACRGGDDTAYYHGPITYVYLDKPDPILDEIAWYGYNSDGNTHPVAEKIENQFGLFDMSGNVWEWCWNYYDDDYYFGPDTTGPSGGHYRVVRGGCLASPPIDCRSANRHRFLPTIAGPWVGFRMARTQITP